MWRSKTLLSMLALVGLVAACSSSAPKTSTPATNSPTSPTSATATAPSAAVADLASTGKLRLAVQGPGFLANGTPPAGVAVDLATALASGLGVPLVTTVYADPPALLAAANSPGWDVAVLPMTSATVAAVDFSAPVILLPHTLLVRSGSSISAMAEADRPGVTIASAANSPHTAVLAGQLKHARLVKVATDADGLAMLKAGQVDAFADGRFKMPQDMSAVPGSHVLTDDFLTARFGFAVTKGHANGLAYVTQFVEQLKASGAVKSAIDKTHLSDINVAPAGS